MTDDLSAAIKKARAFSEGKDYTDEVEWRRTLKILADAAESTLPKYIDVWHVEYSKKLISKWEPCVLIRSELKSAQALADSLRDIESIKCIRITGPHQHRIS